MFKWFWTIFSLGAPEYCVDYLLPNQCLRNLPGEVLLKSFTLKYQAYKSNRTLLFKRYITTIHWINFSGQCDKICGKYVTIYSKDLHSPSIHQSWLSHPIILRALKQEGVWTIQRSILFSYFFSQKAIFYSYYTMFLTCQLLIDMVDMMTNINH